MCSLIVSVHRLSATLREQWSQRLILESWDSICEPTSINEHIVLPSVYRVSRKKVYLLKFSYCNNLNA